MPKFCRENFHGWRENRKIHESFLPREVIGWSIDILYYVLLLQSVPHAVNACNQSLHVELVGAEEHNTKVFSLESFPLYGIGT